jgi:hypothetical protein
MQDEAGDIVQNAAAHDFIDVDAEQSTRSKASTVSDLKWINQNQHRMSEIAS